MNLEGVVVVYTLRFLSKATHNQVKYEAMLARLKLTKELKVNCLQVFTNSQLIAGQITKEFEARDPIMAKTLIRCELLYQSSSALASFTFQDGRTLKLTHLFN